MTTTGCGVWDQRTSRVNFRGTLSFPIDRYRDMLLDAPNSDEHSLMNRFHKPGDEKRSVVIVPPTEYAAWLSCKSTDEARSFLQLYPVEATHTEAYPLPPRKAAGKPANDSDSSFL